MVKTLNTLDNIILEMKMIQLQLHLAKRSNKLSQSSIKTEIHINHSLENLNCLIAHIDDFKTTVELQHSRT